MATDVNGPETPDDEGPVTARVTRHHLLAENTDLFSFRRDTDDSWMLTYLDVLSLLIAIFVLMLSVAIFDDPGSGDIEGEQEAVDPLGSGILMGGLGLRDMPVDRILLPKSDEPVKPTWEEMFSPEKILANLDRQRPDDNRIADLANEFDRQDFDGDIRVRQRGEHLSIELDADLLFPTGRTDLDAAARADLDRIATLLAREDIVLFVEGHTDNVPISGGPIASNWELSALRSAAVVRALAQSGVDPRRLRVLAYGEYHPVAEGQTEDAREKNRRVNLVVGFPR